ncbi:hypothetical protein VTK56DRAFT_2622 [Thermocarpiscus australiensis]
MASLHTHERSNIPVKDTGSSGAGPAAKDSCLWGSKATQLAVSITISVIEAVVSLTLLFFVVKRRRRQLAQTQTSPEDPLQGNASSGRHSGSTSSMSQAKHTPPYLQADPAGSSTSYGQQKNKAPLLMPSQTSTGHNNKAQDDRNVGHAGITQPRRHETWEEQQQEILAKAEAYWEDGDSISIR